MTPKRLSKRTKALLPFLLLAVLIGIFSMMGGCETDFDKVKLNREVVQEYNRSIEQFNKFSHAFTKLGQYVNSVGEDGKPLDEAFWEEVEKKDEPVRQQTQILREFPFQFEDFTAVNEDILPLLDEADAYRDIVSGLKESKATTIASDVHETLKQAYQSILQRSGDVVNTYDRLYMEFVMRSKTEP